MEHHYTCTRMAKKNKNKKLIMPSAGEDVEKLDHSHTAVGNAT